MPKPVKSFMDGSCGRCQQPYHVGDIVTYSTLKGTTGFTRYHYPTCPTEPTPTESKIVPKETTPEQMSAFASIKKLNKSSKWYDIFPQIMAAGLTRVLLAGPPGTGKSTTASLNHNLRVTCHESAGPEDFIGTFIQKEGNTIWIDGPATLAMKNGKRLIIDEIDHISAETESLLYALMDDAPQIMLPTGEIVVAIEGYQVVATTNASPNDLKDAIFDRIEAILIADIPHSAALDNLRQLSGEKATKIVAVVNNFYRNSVPKTAWNFKAQPTLRKMRNFAKLLSCQFNEDLAAQIVFGTAAKEILSCMTTAAI